MRDAQWLRAWFFYIMTRSVAKVVLFFECCTAFYQIFLIYSSKNAHWVFLGKREFEKKTRNRDRTLPALMSPSPAGLFYKGSFRGLVEKKAGGVARDVGVIPKPASIDTYERESIVAVHKKVLERDEPSRELCNHSSAVFKRNLFYFTSSKSASWISSLPFCCVPPCAPCCAPCAKSCAPG